jgi:hypothetical protein
VKIPFDGEFALKIFVKLLNEPEDSVLTNILTFLIQYKCPISLSSLFSFPLYESVHVCMDSFATVLMSMAYREAAIRYHLGNEYR